MPTSLYNFQYVPLTGRLPGKSFVSQTEQAINGLAQYVYDNSTNYEAVKAIAQKAEEDSSNALEYSEEALDKAQTALETVGRAYIKTTSAVDLNDYFDSELLVILSTASTNLPANISGYLTVMSSDTHDYCMQVYIGIDGSVYKRTATISDDVPTFGAWSETPITMSSLQAVLADYAKANASNVGVNAQTDNSIAWGNAIGGGEIAEDEQRLITGGTVYPLSQNVVQNTSNIATNTADIVQNTGGISANSKRISNIEKLLQGNLYDYQTDSTSAYTKSVPAGAMPYAGIEQIGGKTVVWNQLVPNGNFADNSHWFVGTNLSLSIADNVGTATVTGTLTANYISIGSDLNNYSASGHIVLAIADVKGDHGEPGLGLTQTTGGTSGIIDLGDGWTRKWKITTLNDGGGHYVQVQVGSQFTSYTVGEKFYGRNVMVFDLTLMFGSGNEPTTYAQFIEWFPASYYPYNAGTLLSAGVTSVVSQGYNLFDKSTAKLDYFIDGNNISAPATDFAHSDYIPVMPGQTYYFSEIKNNGQHRWFEYDENKNLINKFSNPTTGAFTVGSTTRYVRVNLTKAAVNTCVFNVSNASLNGTYKPYKAPITYPIPTAIRNLEGYGWSAGTAYNYVDFERKVFVKNVGAVDLGTLTWVYDTSYTNPLFVASVPDLKSVNSNEGNKNVLTPYFERYSGTSIKGAISIDKAINATSWEFSSNNHKISILYRAYTDATAFKTAMNGVMLYYELATPQETDISEYLTDDNLINVESGGTLTFPNSNGDDYQIPVPSEETYMIDLQSAIGG